MPAPKPRKPQKPVDVKSGKNVVRQVNVPIDDTEVLDTDMGNAARASMMKSPPAGLVTVGLAIGATINVGDFQSARIDAFIIRNVPDIPGAPEAEFANISKQLNKELERQTEILLEDHAEPTPPPARKRR